MWKLSLSVILLVILRLSVGYDFSSSMYRTAEVLQEEGIDSEVLFLAGCAAMDRSRDILIDQFLESDATHCMQIDSDLGWNAYDIVKMLRHDVDFIAGVYPVKQAEPKFLVNFNGERGKGLIGADGVPGGFCLIKREAIEAMNRHFPELYAMGESDGVNGKALYWLHTHEVTDGRVWGEDMAFCRRAREAGIKIWVNPLINLRHWNGKDCFDHRLMGNLIRAKAS